MTTVVLVVIIYTISGLTTVCWMGNLMAGSRLDRELIKPGIHTSIISLPAAFDKVNKGEHALSALFYSSVLCIGGTCQVLSTYYIIDHYDLAANWQFSFVFFYRYFTMRH